MISANDLRNVKLTKTDKGYSIEEVNATLNAAATTIDAYVNENKELYRKMELLAARIEEYREEEDSIKSALITAQKMADQIRKESSEKADKTVTDANDQAGKIVSEARDYANSIIKQKTDEANAMTSEAEQKANEAINSSKIVAQNILDQAKEISEDLISKSKEEKEAYESLNASLRANTQEFIATVSSMYLRQLEILKDAQLDTAKSDEKEVDSIQKEVDNLVGEIDEMEGAIPENVSIEPVAAAEEIETEDEPTAEAETETETEAEDDVFEELTDEDMKEAVEKFSEEPEEPQDPMKAVEAFSQNGMTPIEKDAFSVPEITEDAPVEEDEEGSLFEEQKPNFEKYFHVNKQDAHGDRTQTISLVPPEDDDDEQDDEPKFKGFFGKKK
ncbi:MAG: DivIVA domain-containing protein [Eubacterium sp.]|nr:DivIVA domain-containing protein [Eubacterium sp.]